ncbi:MAG TPA: TIM barrel protein, partial [Fimbriimonadaceae bacterium]|nr:TIM barrel protein [Fimbriimonadaceae bacterium]
MTRREMLQMTTVAGLAMASGVQAFVQEAPRKGRLRHSVCRWCYGRMSLDELCTNAKGMGIEAIDLLSEGEWATVKKHGLLCSTANGPGGITDGWNTPQNHDKLVAESERLLPLVAAAGIPQMIVFSGNRRGISDAEGLKNCETGLKRIMPLAEKLGVTVIMELLNSRVDHGD